MFHSRKTLGKLHFDPFDNFLCQVAGEKQLIIFDPAQSSELYEGHIPEAQFDFDFETSKFSKKSLLESTSMVMSPVNIRNPDYSAFPLYSNAVASQCVIQAGDCLYLPAFWWHEVQSKPDAHSKNIAVNYWFEPFITKEFPCPTCPREVNPEYHHLLKTFSQAAKPVMTRLEKLPRNRGSPDEL